MKVVEETEVAIPHRLTPFSVSMYKLGSSKRGIIIPMKVQRKELLMEVDTGAGVSIFSVETYGKYFFSIPLTPCSTQLHIYTGGTIKVRGQFYADVLYDD